MNLVEPEERTLSLNPYPASATVLVKYKTPKLDLKSDQIAKMVAGSVPGLTPDKVFVTLTHAPLRPLPDLDSALEFRRIIWVAGIGLFTILLFVALAWILRRRASIRRQLEKESVAVAETGNLDMAAEPRTKSDKDTDK